MASVQKVLILGDGNFSFSNAYIKKYKSSIALTATSYDSYEEVIRKYPESISILKNLNDLGVTVLHNIDATKLHLEETSQGKKLENYNLVIFNHPHCGQENVKRHQNLISHFFFSVRSVMDVESCCEVHVTLASNQHENWEMTQRANKWNFSLKDDILFDESQFPNYERKRHQNGKSFHTIVLDGKKTQQQSRTFIYTYSSKNEDKISNHLSAKRKRSIDKDEKEEISQIEFQCTNCSKGFKTQQGLKTHFNMIHVLKQGGSEKNCSQCRRVFVDEEAYEQHYKSKHGNDTDIKPDWYLNKSIKEEGSFRCDICESSFLSSEGLEQHSVDLAPDVVTNRHCSICNAIFVDHRALRQHQNFCTSKSKK